MNAELGASGQGSDGGWRVEVARLLENQLQLCHELNGLSERQSAIVSSGETEMLLRVLAERQAVVDAIGGLNERLEPMRADWDARLESLSEQERQGLRQKVEEIERVVGQIAARDDADRASLESQRTVVSNQMRSVMKGRGAAAAYGRPTAMTGPRFHDQKG